MNTQDCQHIACCRKAVRQVRNRHYCTDHANLREEIDSAAARGRTMRSEQTTSGNAPKLIEDHERTEDARTEARLDAIYDREEREEANQ